MGKRSLWAVIVVLATFGAVMTWLSWAAIAALDVLQCVPIVGTTA